MLTLVSTAIILCRSLGSTRFVYLGMFAGSGEFARQGARGYHLLIVYASRHQKVGGLSLVCDF